MATTNSLNDFQLACRIYAGVCPVCRDRGTGLFPLVKQVVRKSDDESGSFSFGGCFLVCSRDRDHNHYYLSEQGRRERKGASLPPVEMPKYEGTRIIRRRAA